MVHSNTEWLTDYWRARLPAFGCPPRAAVDPTDFIELLPQVFILGRAAPGRYSFRLVGGLLADLHGRDLREEDFLSQWAPLDRPFMQSAMEGAARRADPLVVESQGCTADGAAADMEMLLAPMTGAGGGVDRFLGLYQPLTPLARLSGQPLLQLSARRIGVTGGREIVADAPRLRLASLDGRRIA